MKYVYVLTSSEKDVYYEQFFLSVTSLRLYNPEAPIIVLIDEKTKQGLTGKRAGYEKLVSEIKVIPVPGEFSQKEASRWIKTSIHQYVTDAFMFIDCDTVIAGKLNSEFPDHIKIGAVLDNHTRLNNHRLYQNLINDNVVLDFTSIKTQTHYYNGGLIYCRNTEESRAFFDRWHILWLECREKGSSQDMPALNQANFELNGIISELGGEWNCQIAFGGLAYLHKAKIIHYFATELAFFNYPYSLASKPVSLSIKENGNIPEYVLKQLQNPLSAFEENTRIISDENMLAVINSSMFVKLLWIKKQHNSLFIKMDAAVASLTKFIKKITRYKR